MYHDVVTPCPPSEKDYWQRFENAMSQLQAEKLPVTHEFVRSARNELYQKFGHTVEEADFMILSRIKNYNVIKMDNAMRKQTAAQRAQRQTAAVTPQSSQRQLSKQQSSQKQPPAPEPIKIEKNLLFEPDAADTLGNFVTDADRQKFIRFAKELKKVKTKFTDLGPVITTDDTELLEKAMLLKTKKEKDQLLEDAAEYFQNITSGGYDKLSIEHYNAANTFVEAITPSSSSSKNRKATNTGGKSPKKKTAGARDAYYF